MRRRRQKRAIAAQTVSIHASVKDATRRDSRVAFHLPSFNPRICKRCDRRDPRVAFHLPGFNPRICKRCDYCDQHQPLTREVSIHASVKDATWLRCRLASSLRCFNPRICKRCDKRLKNSCKSDLRFNPRICKRCDILTIFYPITEIVSIHASVKDATRLTCSLISLISVSIHASVKDATGYTIRKIIKPIVSIHASVKDATGNWIKSREYFNVSIHASVKDATERKLLRSTGL